MFTSLPEINYSGHPPAVQNITIFGEDRIIQFRNIKDGKCVATTELCRRGVRGGLILRTDPVGIPLGNRQQTRPGHFLTTEVEAGVFFQRLLKELQGGRKITPVLRR